MYVLSKYAKELIETLHKFKHLEFHERQIYSLSHGEFMVLSHLRELNQTESSEPATASSLSKKYVCSMPAISKRISGLEEKGYVKRSSIEGDRRSSSVQLTDLGLERIEGAFREMDNMTNRIMDRFGEDNANELIQCLNKLYEIVADEMKQDDGVNKEKKKG